MNRLTIVTGLSGSGKSVALHTLEDEGFYCIDNLPSSMVNDLLDNVLADKNKLFEKLAIGIDMRGEQSTSDQFLTVLKSLHARSDLQTDVLFLDTSRQTLSTRFSETRRRHPLSSPDVPLMTAIDKEIELLTGVKNEADLVIDTSLLNLHQLRNIISTDVLSRSSAGLSLIFQSFGFKHGQPTSTDFMFDVRCLPNPYWEPELREFTGRDEPIIDFLGGQENVMDMFSDIQQYIARWLPHFENENRSYLTVSIGCTGGRHRSVYLCELLAAQFSAIRDNVSIRHREIS